MPETLLAAMLMMTPPGTPEAAPPIDRWPALREAVQSLALEWEVLDQAEMKYIFAEHRDFAIDLDILRRRVVELADAPRSAEAFRFPDRRLSAELIQFNRGYRANLAKRQTIEADRFDDLSAAIKETDRLYHIWDAVRDARCDYYHVTVRRAALKRLKTMLGDEDYLTATLPPNVPTWRFAERE